MSFFPAWFILVGNFVRPGQKVQIEEALKSKRDLKGIPFAAATWRRRYNHQLDYQVRPMDLSFSINSIHNLNIRIQAKKLWVSCLTEIYLAMFPVFLVILRNLNRNTCTVAHQTTIESCPQCTWSHFHIIVKSLHYPGWFRAKNLRVKLVKLQMNFGLFCRTWLWF